MPARTRDELPPHVGHDDCVLLFDGECVLCGGWARFLIRHDKRYRFKLATLQSDEGQALLKHFDFSTEQFNSLVLVEGPRAFTKSTAFIRVVARLPLPWKLAAVCWLCPAPIRDWCYDRIAVNRYALFGQHESCIVPTPDHERRMLRATRG